MRRYTQSRNRLSDRDMLLDIMNTEKYISMLYERATTEASNNTVYNAFKAFQDDQHENARTLFSLMQERGWYQTRRSSGTFYERSSRLERNFDIRQDSRYAVATGSKRFGGRLSHQAKKGPEGPKSKSGIFTKRHETDTRLWQ